MSSTVSFFFTTQNPPNQRTSPGHNRRATCPLINHTKRKRRQTTSPPLTRPTIRSNRGAACPLISHNHPTTCHTHCLPKRKGPIQDDPGDEGPLNPCPSVSKHSVDPPVTQCLKGGIDKRCPSTFPPACTSPNKAISNSLSR